MKPIFYTALLLAMPATLLSQPTITKMENHTIGTVVKQARDTINFPAQGNAGPNQTWNFTALAAQDTLTERVVSPSSTTFGSSFPDASYVRITDAGNYTYIQKTPSENYMVGMVDSTTNTSTKYYDKTVYSQNPLTYLKSVSDNYTSLMTMSADTSKGSIQATADGWGTLILPTGTFSNTMRVKLVIHQVDSIQVGPTKIASVMDATVYQWYDNQHYSPLMRWDSTHVDFTLGQLDFTTINYLVSETYPVSVQNVSQNMYNACMTSGKVIIKGNFERSKYFVSLYDLSGRKIQFAELPGGSQLEMPVHADLPGGMYFVTLQSNETGIETIKLIKQ